MSKRAAWLPLVLGTIALAAVGCEGSRPDPTRVTGDGVRLSAALQPAKPRVGANQLFIDLENSDGQPILGSNPAVKVHMVAMGAMPAMGGAASIEEVGGGRYRADFELEMGGTWIVAIDAGEGGSRPERFEGSLTVGNPGVRLRAERTEPTPEAAGSERHPAEFSVPPARLQKVGVRTQPVERASISLGLRTVGRVVYDETRLEDISPKIGGWIQELRADAVGMHVEKGSVLYTVYSPELYAAQQELLQALLSEGAFGSSMVRAAKNRLRLFGMSRGDIERIAERGEPLEALPVRSPASGFVIEKNVVAGSAITSGQRLMRIAPLDPIWIEIDVYEADLDSVRPGQSAEITLAHVPGRTYQGEVTFVYPYLLGDTRTARARVELANPDLSLRPDMFANVSIQNDSREALLVPESAVLHAGERQFVFLALGGGRFRPQPVEVGVRQGGRVEILSGLSGEEEVVSSGTFLIASESRLRAGLDQW